MKCENSLIVLNCCTTARLRAFSRIFYMYYNNTACTICAPSNCRMRSAAIIRQRPNASTPAALICVWLVDPCLGWWVVWLPGCLAAWLLAKPSFYCCKKCQACDLYRKINDFYSYAYIMRLVQLDVGTSSFALRTTFLCKTPATRYFFA